MSAQPETLGGSYTAYRVEARARYPAQAENGQIFGPEWAIVNFAKCAIGVPSHFLAPDLFDGMLTYEAAQALRWWFIATTHHRFDTRLVPHKIKYSAESIAGEGEEVIEAFQQRPRQEPQP